VLSSAVVQLAGRLSSVMKAQTAAKSALVTVAQLASPGTTLLYAAASSVMQVEYSATVAVQVEEMSPQLGLGGSACRQAVSLLVQFACN
jgi:acetyl-CoA acetyltransferase